MPVIYVKGNILNWPEHITVFCHGVNRQRAFGSGLAGQIREEYPAAFEAYDKAFEEGAPGLGSVVPCEVAGGKRIIHCFTQDRYGKDGTRYLDYEALYVCLESIRDILEKAHSEGRPWVLGIPQWIGGGLAGGDPRIIKAMVEALFGESPVRCVVVEYPKKATELEIGSS